ncbi:MAG: hypothetical protein K1W20_11510 [Lachnospiraceae bacterium]
MKRKKNRFWLFVFSLMPGAGHMYIGFMKMGVSFMAGFLLSCVVVGITGIGALAAISIIIYAYAFFHANNLGSLDDEQFAAMEDEYLFGFADMDYSRLKLSRKNKNIAAAALIVLGVCMLWNVGFGMLRDYMGWDNPMIRAIYYTMRDEVPRVVIALAVIWFGVALLRGKKDTEAPLMQLEQKERQPKEPMGEEKGKQSEVPKGEQSGEQMKELRGEEKDGQADGQQEV